MTKETIVDVPGLTLWYYPAMGIIHHEVQKYPGTQVLEAALEQGLKLIETRGARKWLSDDRRGGALPKAHHEWGQKIWGPKAAAAGWKYWALMPPAELLASTNMLRLAETYGALGVTVKTFSSPKAAMDWLASCE